jgi:uncharacterized protein YmfQ (DUF2313 family)
MLIKFAGLCSYRWRVRTVTALGYRILNNPEKTSLALTNVCVEVLPDPDMKWDAPFLAVNKSVVTIVRALKE